MPASGYAQDQTDVAFRHRIELSYPALTLVRS